VTANRVFDPLEGIIPLSPDIIREETFYLDIDKDVLSEWTGKKVYLGVKRNDNEVSDTRKEGVESPRISP